MWSILAILGLLVITLDLAYHIGLSGASQAIVVLPRFSVLAGPPTIGAALACFWAVAALGGYLEWKRHLRNLEAVPIRIHVNGSRGKTGTCRLIGAALRANGLKVVTKTTGKMPAIIDIWGKERILRESESDGFPEGNIREQKSVVALAAKQGADALVVECMALSPEIQQISEERFIRATVGVITNIRHDHLDVIGPDLVSAARYLCRMIPKNQVVVTCEENLLPTIEQEAAKRGSKVITADPLTVPDSIINAFPYITFRENLAIALKVSQLLGLDRDKSLEGMLKSSPDFGTVRIFYRQGVRARYMVVTAFGVNDVDSLTTVMEELLRRGKIPRGPMVGLFNSRKDRAQRSAEFGRLMGRKISFEKIIITGEYIRAFVRSAVKVDYPRRRLIEMENADAKEILGLLDNSMSENGVVIATGNMVTSFGYGLVRMLEEEKPAWPSQLSMIPS